jgi:hypothetical protein
MSDINMLVVADGIFSFAPNRDPTDVTFTLTEFIYLVTSSTPIIAADTAHRRQNRADPKLIGVKFARRATL